MGQQQILKGVRQSAVDGEGKRGYFGKMKKSLFIVGLLLIAVAIFEFSPGVEKAQSYVSLANYKNAQTSCQDLLTDRPWYGKLNYWFFAWLVFVPALIFSVTPSHPAWMRGGRIIVAAGVCYALMNLAIHLQWDIRNAPFHEDPYHPDPANGWRMDCANNSGDGFSYVIALLSAWIPACIYAGLCLFVWRFYHRRFSKEITENYKSDIITRIFFWGLKVYSIVVLLYLALFLIFIAYGYFMHDFLFHPPILGLIMMLLIRPLIIPFEILMY